MPRRRVTIEYKVRVVQRSTVRRHLSPLRLTYSGINPVEGFRCESCGAIFEETEPPSDEVTTCPDCGRIVRPAAN